MTVQGLVSVPWWVEGASQGLCREPVVLGLADALVCRARSWAIWWPGLAPGRLTHLEAGSKAKN